MENYWPGRKNESGFKLYKKLITAAFPFSEIQGTSD